METKIRDFFLVIIKAIAIGIPTGIVIQMVINFFNPQPEYFPEPPVLNTAGPILVKSIYFPYSFKTNFPNSIVRLVTSIGEGVERNSLVFLNEASYLEKSNVLFVAPHLFNIDSIEKILQTYSISQVHFGYRIQFSIPMTNVGNIPAKIDYCLISSSSDNNLNLKNLIMTNSIENTMFFRSDKLDTTTVYPGDTVLYNFGIGSIDADEVNHNTNIHIYMIYVDGNGNDYDKYVLSEFKTRRTKIKYKYVPLYERIFENALVMKSNKILHNIDPDSLTNSLRLVYQQPPSLDHKLTDDEVKAYTLYKRKINKE